MDEFVDTTYRGILQHPYILPVGVTPVSNILHGDPLESLYGLISALAYMHRNNIMHGHITSWSLVLHEGRLVLTGFQDAFYLTGVVEEYTPRFRKVAERWRSPETANDEPYDKRSEVWCLGSAFYERITGVKLLPESRPHDHLGDIFFKLVALSNPGLQEILQRMLNYNITERLYADELLKHSYFSHYTPLSGYLAENLPYPYPLQRYSGRISTHETLQTHLDSLAVPLTLQAWAFQVLDVLTTYDYPYTIIENHIDRIVLGLVPTITDYEPIPSEIMSASITARDSKLKLEIINYLALLHTPEWMDYNYSQAVEVIYRQSADDILIVEALQII